MEEHHRSRGLCCQNTSENILTENIDEVNRDEDWKNFYADIKTAIEHATDDLEQQNAEQAREIERLQKLLTENEICHHCDDCRCKIIDGTALCAFCAERRAEIKEMATEIESLKLAFDDRVRVIEMQLEDKKKLKAEVERLNTVISEIYMWTGNSTEIIEKELASRNRPDKA